MLKRITAVLALAVLSAAAAADVAKPAAEKKEGPSLKVGDAAPALKATKWLQGAEVKEFTPGKIYVVEFWATWCGPCIVMMPHMAHMQAEYKDKGVTFIGFTSKDPNNTADKVATFVTKRGPKLGYTFAYADDRDTNDAWMKASGQGGIPCSFVVDQKGKIAYIGHPMFLGEVLPKVVEGTWKAEQDAAEVKKLEEETNKVFEAIGGEDAEAGLKALSDFQAKRPGLAGIPYFVAPKLHLMLKAKKFDEAKKMAEGLVKQAAADEDAIMLRSVAGVLATPEAKGQKELTDLSLKAADALLKAAGDKDPLAFLAVAEIYFAAGDKAKARELGQKAVDAAGDNARLKQAIEQQIKRYGEEKKEGKK
jgi:thiol-disulfide isomerase/thioredoxin